MKADVQGGVEVRDLALFAAVVDAGSITGGAERCHLSLSAASVRITALERRFGLRLLDRRRRGVHPTPAGEELAARGCRVVAGVADLESHMAGRARGLRTGIALAANSSAVDALTEFLAATLNRLPSLAVTLAEIGSEDAVDAVREGRADLAVVSAIAPAPAAFAPCVTRPLWDDPLVAVGAAGPGPPAPLRLDDVLRDPVVGLMPGIPLQERVEQWARDRGLVPAYRVGLPSLAAVCAVAGTGVGRAVVPLGAARRHGVPASGIHPLDEAWAYRRALLVARDFTAFDADRADFIDLLAAYAPTVDAGE